MLLPLDANGKIVITLSRPSFYGAAPINPNTNAPYSNASVHLVFVQSSLADTILPLSLVPYLTFSSATSAIVATNAFGFKSTTMSIAGSGPFVISANKGITRATADPDKWAVKTELYRTLDGGTPELKTWICQYQVSPVAKGQYLVMAGDLLTTTCEAYVQIYPDSLTFAAEIVSNLTEPAVPYISFYSGIPVADTVGAILEGSYLAELPTSFYTALNQYLPSYVRPNDFIYLKSSN
jgi:hypothetical protein